MVTKPIYASNNEGESDTDPSPPIPAENPRAELAVGLKIRELRTSRHLSMRNLAELSGLSLNTLSLVETGKSSPSVSTLQQLASALKVPLTAFFESASVRKHVVFTRYNQAPQASFGSARMENLGKDLAGNAVQPFVVTLEPGAGSGPSMIVHTGYEFVYCLSGMVLYRIDDFAYCLEPGDSLLFESHLRHRWECISNAASKIILVLYSADALEEPGGHHFQAA